MPKRKAEPDACEAETQRCVRQLTKALAPFSPLARHSATTVYALTALQAKDTEEVAAWLDTLAAGVRDGSISLTAAWRVN